MREEVERALALNPNLAEAHIQLGRIKQQIDFESGLPTEELAQRPAIYRILEEAQPADLKHIAIYLRLIPAGGSTQLSLFVLKRFLSIFSDLIFDSSVERGMPNLPAAPCGPNTRPRLSFSAVSIMLFS